MTQLAMESQPQPATNPHEELTLALEMQKGRPRSVLPADVTADEKKDDPIEEEMPIEEGQEAMWVDPVRSPKSTSSASPRSSFFRSKKTTDSGEKSQKSHVVLLPPAEPTPVESTAPVPENQRKCFGKIETARQLLDQALHPSADVGSRDLLAKAAFENAKEARRLTEPGSTELETILLDASTKGCAAVASARALQLSKAQETTAVAADEEEDLEDNEHVTRARSLLESILPPEDVVLTLTGNNKSPDGVSTLGFDNTFEQPNSKDNFDILSMSSLNEILDGPMESPTMVMHRIPKDTAETKEEEPEMDKPAKKSERKGGILGMFRTKKGQQTKKATSTPPKETAPVTKRSPLKTPTQEKLTSSYTTTVVFEDGPTHPNGIVDHQEEVGIANLDQLEKIKAIDEATNRRLKDAIDNDGTESLTSFQGVPMHGKNEQKTEEDATKQESGEEEEQEQRDVVEVSAAASRRSPARNFEKIKPKFMAAPKGDAAILTSKSWDSLMEDEDMRKKYEEYPENSFVNVRDSLEGGQMKIPSSPAGSERNADDRYAVDPDEDRYAVESEAGGKEMVLDCVPSKFSLVPGAETCSTLGLASRMDPKSSDVEQQQMKCDKYALSANEVSDEEDGEVYGLRVPSRTSSKVSTTGSKTSVTSSEKSVSKKPLPGRRKDRTPVKQRKLKTPGGVVAGLFGFRKSKGTKSDASIKSTHSKNQSSARALKKNPAPTKKSPLKKKSSAKSMTSRTSTPPKSVLKTKDPVVTCDGIENLPETQLQIAPLAAEPTTGLKEESLKTDHQAEEETESDTEDPLVVRLKQNKEKRGMDPSSIDMTSAIQSRGIDP